MPVTTEADQRAAQQLKTRLERTWSAFFAQFGSFRPIQLAALPAVLDGHNVVIAAPTAGGKTEAALAGLIERHCPPLLNQISSAELHLIYIVPTRALVHDLARRLEQPLAHLRLPLAVKTHDENTLNPSSPASVLITTPESLDSLLMRHPRLLITLRALVIDELHLFDGTSRGDQLRVLLNRIRRIKAYAMRTGVIASDAVQYVALSATLTNPLDIAHRYFPNPVVIQSPGKRPLSTDLIELDPENPIALLDYLQTFQSHGWHKALVFCNSRAEVELIAAIIRSDSVFGDAVFTHYSNIPTKRRHAVEADFASRGTAICVATSTLELGIDIGDVDVVLMIGVPNSPQSFWQRIGRGSRRLETTVMAGFWRTATEALLYQALCASADLDPPDEASTAFQQGVAVQQMFSLIGQNHNGSIRLMELRELFDGLLDHDLLLPIVGHLVDIGYLQPGRSDEWRAGPQLNTLIDQQSMSAPPFSLHSNIRISRQIEVRHQGTQEVIAWVDPAWVLHETLTLEGRSMRIEWSGDNAVWVTGDNLPAIDRGHFTPSRQVISYELAQMLRQWQKIDQSFIAVAPDRWRLNHYSGDIYGRVLTALLPCLPGEHPGLYLEMDQNPDSLSMLTEDVVLDYIHHHVRQIEPLLNLTPYHRLLPPAVQRQTVVEQFNLPRFMAILHRCPGK